MKNLMLPTGDYFWGRGEQSSPLVILRVISIRLCPSRSETTFTGTPSLSARVAQVWRRPWT